MKKMEKEERLQRKLSKIGKTFSKQTNFQAKGGGKRSISEG